MPGTPKIPEPNTWDPQGQPRGRGGDTNIPTPPPSKSPGGTQNPRSPTTGAPNEAPELDGGAPGDPHASTTSVELTKMPERPEQLNWAVETEGLAEEEEKKALLIKNTVTHLRSRLEATGGKLDGDDTSYFTSTLATLDSGKGGARPLQRTQENVERPDGDPQPQDRPLRRPLRDSRRQHDQQGHKHPPWQAGDQCVAFKDKIPS